MTHSAGPTTIRPRPAALGAAGVRAGFTLLELLISIALVLVLMLGINQVFKITSDSIGAAQGLTANVQGNRALQAVLYNDIAQSVIKSPESPCLIINSEAQSAFLSREDELGDIDYPTVVGTTRPNVDTAIRTIDVDDNNVEGEAGVTGEVIPRNQLGRRVFRQDQLTFFARHLFPRQTANDGSYTANQSSGEAMIWYGHLKQPPAVLDDTANNLLPGWEKTDNSNPPLTGGPNGTNPNNFYARQWVLGRVAMLLREPQPDPINPGLFIYDKSTPQAAQSYYRRSDPVGPRKLSPLGQQSVATRNSMVNEATQAQWTRYDLAGTTIDGFREILRDLAFNDPTYEWWRGAFGLGYRFQGYPYPSKPHTSQGMARTVPVLVTSCTQFVVEFAGDFLEQDDTGGVTGNYTTGAVDGLVDFIHVGGVGGNRRVRWYGMPRDVNDPTGAGRPNGQITVHDVVPLQALMGANPIEHIISINPAFDFTALTTEYNAKWGPVGSLPTGTVEPPRPKMLRLTLTIDDAAGRLAEGQTYEYVIEVP